MEFYSSLIGKENTSIFKPGNKHDIKQKLWCDFTGKGFG